jgi:hypothetical protein
MWDLKPEAATEFRGEFAPIDTNVPGMRICEHFPQLAKMADKFAIIRSVVGSVGQHSNFQTHTGFNERDLRNVGGHPSLGSVMAKLVGSSSSGAPAFISYNGGNPGFLGPVYKPFEPKGGSLRLLGNLTEERLDTRTNLLVSLDKIRRDMDTSGQMEALDSFTQRAVGVVTSGHVADALDSKKIDAKEQTRYGKEGLPFLRARKLVEAGVRVVTFNWGGWDTHSNNFVSLKKQLPKLDQGVSCLLEDLSASGLNEDVTVIVWGEFGRSPRINKTAGRDHWPRVMGAFVAGGGMRLGQVIGSTTKNADYAQDRPVDVQEIFSTLYRNLGIDVASTTIPDTNGRPQYLADKRKVIDELV